MRATIRTTKPDRRGRAQVVVETRDQRSRTDVQCNRPEPKTPDYPCDVCGKASYNPNAVVWLCYGCNQRAHRRRH